MHIPLLSFSPSFQIYYFFLHFHLPSLPLLFLRGGDNDRRQREVLCKPLGNGGYRASEGGTPIFSLLSMYGHSAKEGQMHGGDWKWEQGAMEAEGSIISAGCVGGDFFFLLPSRSGGKFIYFPGSYNEILQSTLLWWWPRSDAINSPWRLVLQWWTIYYVSFKDTAWYLYDSAILCNDIHFIGSI